jgi:hypothetical protein
MSMGSAVCICPFSPKMKVIALLAAVCLTAPTPQSYDQLSDYNYQQNPGYYQDQVQDYQIPQEYYQGSEEYDDRVPQNQEFIHHIRRFGQNVWNRARNFVNNHPIGRQIGNFVRQKGQQLLNQGLQNLASRINFYQEEEGYDEPAQGYQDIQSYEPVEEGY